MIYDYVYLNNDVIRLIRDYLLHKIKRKVEKKEGMGVNLREYLLLDTMKIPKYNYLCNKS